MHRTGRVNTQCFRFTKIIRARNVQTRYNIKPKYWLQIPGHGSGLLVLGFQPGYQVLDAGPFSSYYKVE